MVQKSSLPRTVVQLYFLKINILFHFKRHLAFAVPVSSTASIIVSSTCWRLHQHFNESDTRKLIFLFSVSLKIMKFLIIGDSHLQRVEDSLFQYHVAISSKGGLKAFDLDNQIFHQDFDVFMLILGGNDVHFHQRKNPAPRTPAACAAKLQSCQITLYCRPTTEFN